MRRCLILQGGGLRAAYAAGACLALGKSGIDEFELALAVSASVPTLAYFLAGQCKEIREIWENYLATRRLIRYSNILFARRDDYRHRPLIDTYYLVYEVFKDRLPLRIDRLMASRTEAYFCAADNETHQAHYFVKNPVDMYRLMWACLALPGAVPERPIVDGRSYIDGGAVDPLPIQKALDLGADRILAVLTLPPGKISRKPNAIERWIARRYFSDSPGLIDLLMKREGIYRRSVDLLEKLRKDSPDRVVVVRPERTLPAGRITRNRGKIIQTLDMGYEDLMKKRGAIERLLGRAD